jgi:hypothetical protein
MGVLRWRPQTYRQVWIFAVLGMGAPQFCIWAVVRPPHFLIRALVSAASFTFFSGLAGSWRVNWDRNHGRV